MAKVWFVREGPEPTRGEPQYDLPLTQCIDQLGLANNQWRHGLKQTPQFPTPRPQSVADYRHVVCRLDAHEATAYGWRTGYYLLEISPEEVAKRLGPPER